MGTFKETDIGNIVLPSAFQPSDVIWWESTKGMYERGMIVYVKFTLSKVLYGVLDFHLGRIVEDVDSLLIHSKH